MRHLLTLSLMCCTLWLCGQDFVNNDLEGTVTGLSQPPPDWAPLFQCLTPACEANFNPGTTADMTTTTMPDLELGLIGNPYSGNTFVSAIAADSYGFVYMEGIMQTVTGFTIDSVYEIHFYQAVVKQANMEDPSGAWVVYADDQMIGTSEVSFSSAPYNSTSFNWEKRSVVFTATSTYHAFKFMAVDDDDNGIIDEYDVSGAVRMGIDSIFITPWCNLNANLGPDTTLCSGDSLLLSVTSSNAEYQWQDGSDEDHYWITEAGTYSVEVSNMCGTLSDYVEISYDDVLDNVALGDDMELCNGDSSLLELPEYENVSYSWSDGEGDNNMWIQEAGLYYVDMQSEFCSKSDSIELALQAYPNYIPFFDTTLCEGDLLMLDPETDESVDLTWQDQSDLPFFVVSQPGNYWVDISQNGCAIRHEANIHYIPMPHLNFAKDTMMCNGQRLRLNINHEMSDFMWQDLSTNPILNIDEEGLYSAIVSNQCGVARDSIWVRYGDCKCTVYVPNAFTPNADGRNDGFGPTFDCHFENYQLLIFDRWGQTIFESNDPRHRWDGSLNGNTLPIGIYGYRLTYDAYLIDEKVQVGGPSPSFIDHSRSFPVNNEAFELNGFPELLLKDTT